MTIVHGQWHRHPARRLVAGLGLAAALAAGVGAGCRHHDPPPRSAAASAPAGGDFVAGEVVLTLEEGAAPPERLGERACQPGAWASARVVVVRCPLDGAPASPEADARATTALVEAARATPGVRSADFNWRRAARAQ